MKKIYREFFYIPKHVKVSDRVFQTRTILSTLTMIICCAIFCSGTFAWFESNRSSQISPITAASYSLSVEIDGVNIGTSSYQSAVSYTCPLATEDLHTVTLTHSGTAENGYCVINAGSSTCSTAQIGKDESITLTIKAAQGENITFSAKWGEYQSGVATYSVSDGNSYPVYEDGDCIIISTTPYEVYTVTEGATIELIAEHYGVSVSDILLYNGISELTVGEEIKIPNTEVTEPLVIAEEVSYVLYTVAEGVTIEMLAEYYGVSAEEILNFNNITELIVGMEIRIPNTTVTEPFVLEETPATEDVATPPNATPSDAEENEPDEEETDVPGTEETSEPTEPTESSQPTEVEGDEVTDQTVPTETEPTEDSTEPETAPIETEAPTEESVSDETEPVTETEEVIETVAASTDEATELTTVPETTANEETASATESEITDAQ